MACPWTAQDANTFHVSLETIEGTPSCAERDSEMHYYVMNHNVAVSHARTLV